MTLAEAAAFGLADLHYRTAEPALDAGRSRSPAWEPAPDRHWHATLPPGATAVVADVLASPARQPRALRRPRARTARRAGARRPATRSRSSPARPGPARSPPGRRRRRSRCCAAGLVRRLAHEHTDVVADAVDAQRTTGGSVAERDARAAAELAVVLPLWAGRARARSSGGSAAAGPPRRCWTASTRSSPRPRPRRPPSSGPTLAAADLSPDEVDVAMAAAPVPLGVVPEDLEDDRRRVPGLAAAPAPGAHVRAGHRRRLRAARPGAPPGAAGLGGARPAGRASAGTAGRQATAVTHGAGAVTLRRRADVRPAEVPAASGRPRPCSSRDVLRTAIGTEVDQPHPDLARHPRPARPAADDLRRGRRDAARRLPGHRSRARSSPASARTARRTGRRRAGTRRGVLRGGPPGDAGRRPRRRRPLIDGPWPRVDAADRRLDARARRSGSPRSSPRSSPTPRPRRRAARRSRWRATGPFVGSTAGSVPLDADCVPELARRQCLRVRFALAGECSDG